MASSCILNGPECDVLTEPPNDPPKDARSSATDELMGQRPPKDARSSATDSDLNVDLTALENPGTPEVAPFARPVTASEFGFLSMQLYYDSSDLPLSPPKHKCGWHEQTATKVPPLAPLVEIVQVTCSSLRLKWNFPNTGGWPLEEIEVCCISGTPTVDKRLVLPGDATGCTVNGLRADTKYGIRVKGKNPCGWGHTNRDTYSKTGSVNVSGGPSAPELAAPPFAKRVLLKWFAPHSEVTEYEILTEDISIPQHQPYRLVVAAYLPERPKIQLGKHSSTRYMDGAIGIPLLYEINGLRPSSRYRLSLRSRFHGRWSSFSDSLEIRTAPHLTPLPPSCPELISKSMNCCTIRWIPAPDPDPELVLAKERAGMAKSRRLSLIRAGKTPEDEGEEKVATAPGKRYPTTPLGRSLEFSGRDLDTTSESSREMAKTVALSRRLKTEIPDDPIDRLVHTVNRRHRKKAALSASMKRQEEIPSFSVSPTTGFKVELSRDGGVEWFRFVEVPIPVSTVHIGGLEQCTEYVLRVRALNEQGWGKPSRLLMVQTFGASVPRKGPTPKFLGATHTSLQLVWKPPKVMNGEPALVEAEIQVTCGAGGCDWRACVPLDQEDPYLNPPSWFLDSQQLGDGTSGFYAAHDLGDTVWSALNSANTFGSTCGSMESTLSPIVPACSRHKHDALSRSPDRSRERQQMALQSDVCETSSYSRPRAKPSPLELALKHRGADASTMQTAHRLERTAERSSPWETQSTFAKSRNTTAALVSPVRCRRPRLMKKQESIWTNAVLVDPKEYLEKSEEKVAPIKRKKPALARTVSFAESVEGGEGETVKRPPLLKRAMTFSLGPGKDAPLAAPPLKRAASESVLFAKQRRLGRTGSERQLLLMERKPLMPPSTTVPSPQLLLHRTRHGFRSVNVTIKCRPRPDWLNPSPGIPEETGNPEDAKSRLFVYNKRQNKRRKEAALLDRYRHCDCPAAVEQPALPARQSRFQGLCACRVHSARVRYRNKLGWGQWSSSRRCPLTPVDVGAEVAVRWTGPWVASDPRWFPATVVKREVVKPENGRKIRPDSLRFTLRILGLEKGFFLTAAPADLRDVSVIRNLNVMEDIVADLVSSIHARGAEALHRAPLEGERGSIRSVLERIEPRYWGLLSGMEPIWRLKPPAPITQRSLAMRALLGLKNGLVRGAKSIRNFVGKGVRNLRKRRPEAVLISESESSEDFSENEEK